MEFLLWGIFNDIVLLEFFPKKIHCIHLRFGDTFHVNIHRDTNIAVPQNCLNVLVCHSELMTRFRVETRAIRAARFVPEADFPRGQWVESPPPERIDRFPRNCGLVAF